MIDRASDAVREACKIIERNTQDTIKLGGVMKRNQFGHYTVTTEKGLRYWMKFNREIFKTFGIQFQDQGLAGAGESINLQWLDQAKALECTALVFVQPSGRVYCAYLEEFKTYEKNFGTTRHTDATGEVTVSIPIKLLRRWT